jgi:putative component of toxin-antitoxin plasmid stabilization module
MPRTTVYIYAEEDGESPVLEWLKELRRKDLRAYVACRGRVLLLAAMGYELRRPYADMLRDGIYELRARVGNVNYRLLYFFHGKDIAILAHGLTKQAEVPARDIERAIERRIRYEQDPAKHRATVNPADL